MLKIEIHESTPDNMLRAIRAACNELLGETTAGAGTPAPSEDQSTLAGAFDKAVETVGAQAVAQALIDPPAPYAQGGPVNAGQFYRVGEQPSEQTVLGTAQADAPETDSTGAEWNPELHASTKTKNADGTWKKRRGAAQAATETVAQDDAATLVPLPSAPPVPPAPAAPAEPIMPKIFALITSQIVTINQAVEAAQAEGYADLGANGLGGAPVEKQLAVLRKLEGE